MNLKRVYAAKDWDSLWYVMPFELKDEFHLDLENGEQDEWDSFTEKYSKYMTGGDLNLVELWASI